MARSASIEPRDIAMAARDLRARAALTGPLTADQLRREFTDTVDTRITGTVPVGAVLVHPQATWDDLVLPAERQASCGRRWHGYAPRRCSTVGPGRRRRGAGACACCSPVRPAPARPWPPRWWPPNWAATCWWSISRGWCRSGSARPRRTWPPIFDAAERGDAALFFDEADALFGKRTEVGDARDRYANLETAYLLARIERFDGLVVLATNLRQNIDAAFARRLEFIVAFDPPDAGQRLGCGGGTCPAGAAGRGRPAGRAGGPLPAVGWPDPQRGGRGRLPGRRRRPPTTAPCRRSCPRSPLVTLYTRFAENSRRRVRHSPVSRRATWPILRSGREHHDDSTRHPEDVRTEQVARLQASIDATTAVSAQAAADQTAAQQAVTADETVITQLQGEATACVSSSRPPP